MAPSEQDILNLYDYCSARNITIHTSIKPKAVPGCGLGVYTTEEISAEERLVHLPVSEIFTIANVPDHFLSRSARVGLPVHAQLAAFFAFGDEADLEPYEPWMATWPKFQDFYTTMPLFWGELLAKKLKTAKAGGKSGDCKEKRGQPALKKQKVSANGFSRNGSVPIDENDWATGIETLNTVQDQTAQMATKLASHVMSIHNLLPHLDLLEHQDMLTKFFHAWCLVNTRCFYYVPHVPPQSKHKPKVPTDPNEAMALCPFLDLFNHTTPSDPTRSLNSIGGDSVKHCKVKFGAKGCVASTSSKIAADTEILFTYGPHTNDTLWSEYGFLLSGSSNSSDSIQLDRIVLRGMTSEQRLLLEEHDYLGSYTLFNDGSVCFRSEMVAWLFVLEAQLWTKIVEEGLDPVQFAGSGEGQVQQHSEVIQDWLVAVRERSQVDVSKIASISEEDASLLYRSLSILVDDDNSTPADQQASLILRRKRMCIDRCEQVWEMAERGIEVAYRNAMDHFLNEEAPGTELNGHTRRF